MFLFCHCFYFKRDQNVSYGIRGQYQTLSETSPCFLFFLRVCSTNLLKTLRAISPFPTVFSSRLENFLPFSQNLKLLSANSFRLEKAKVCRLKNVIQPFPCGYIFATQSLPLKNLKENPFENIEGTGENNGNKTFSKGVFLMDYRSRDCVVQWLTDSPIHHFETVPNSKKLQTTTEMLLLTDFKVQIA